MTTVTLDLPVDVYQRIVALARQQHKPVEILASEMLTTQSIGLHQSAPERQQVLAILRQAGILVEIPAQQDDRRLSTEERSAIASQIPPGTSLSTLILEDRGAQ